MLASNRTVFDTVEGGGVEIKRLRPGWSIKLFPDKYLISQLSYQQFNFER